MNLLYLCSDFGIRPDGVKGASVHLRAITRALCALGHNVTLLSPHGGAGGNHPAQPLDMNGMSRSDEGVDRLRRWMKSHELPHGVCGELRSLQYNTVAVHPALTALRQNRPDAIVERLSLFGHVGADLAASLHVPHIVEVNALLSREAKQFRDLQMMSLAQRIEHRVLTGADAVTVVSRQLGDQLCELDLDPDSVYVVPNGADLDRYDPNDDGRLTRQALGLGDSLVIGFAGSLKSWHGVDVLLASFARVQTQIENAKLLIVGTGPMEAALKEEVHSEDLEASVVFTGAIDHADIPRHLAAMDVTVAPFRAMEGFYFSPIKIFEYMAAGRCVVGSKLGQIEELITDGINGLLCEPDDVCSLENALLACVKDGALRRSLGDEGRRCVEENYTWRLAAEKTTRIIARAIDASLEDSARSQSSAKTAVGTE